MLDNYSTGLSTGSRIIGGRETFLNSYVNGDNGECDSIRLYFINNNLDTLLFSAQLAIANSLPLIPVEYDLLTQYIKIDYTNTSQYINYKIVKDNLEALGIAYQLEAIGNDIIIGNYFAKFLNLFKGKNTTQLYIWTSETETYNKTDIEKCKGILTANVPLIDKTNYKVYTDIDLTNVTSWAIGTNDGKLVLSSNGKDNSVYLSISKEL
jgi:hypothetical protein